MARFFFYTVSFTFIAVGIALFSTCSPEQDVEPPESRLATQIALDWNHLLLELEWHTPGYRPPVSARMFAYVEMAAYETSLPGLPENISLQTICPGFEKIQFSSQPYCLPAALNAAYSYMATMFFPTASTEFMEKIQRLEEKYKGLIQMEVDPAAIQPSISFGRETARLVWRYSMQDSIGHDAFMYNYDRGFVGKKCNGCWEMDEERPMPPLLPNWGRVRSFAVSNKEVAAHPPVPFDDSAPSAYFSEAMEVFSISNSLSSEERWIAEFWSDDLPGLTITPAARWISIATQAIEKSRPTFPEVMEIYVKTAMALNDAAVICWDNKYKYQVERPETYIRRNIQAGWKPLHDSPSFPSYPSGHAVFGAAVAEVLGDLFSPAYTLVDRTHEGRKEFASKARKFNSFEEMAKENAYSRVLLGVHFRMDCEEGLRLGKIIGQQVSKLSLRKEHVAVVPPRN